MFRDGELRTPRGDLVTATVIENQDYLVASALVARLEAYRKQSITPETVEQQPRRLYLVKT
ncbi:MAG: hypothetical protein IPO20_10300 [Gammaproteobacteria bacterium]|nr:hypothetical protein [Gammaproteobacteria bacterium]